MVAFALAYGITSGLRNASINVVLSSLFGTAAIGAIQGVHQGFLVASTGVGPLLFALSAEHSGGYTLAIVTAAGCLFAAALVTLVADSCTLGLLRGQQQHARLREVDVGEVPQEMRVLERARD